MKALRIDSQIKRLKEKGIVVLDDHFAFDILSRKNYYNLINAFKNLFFDENEKIKYPGITFEEIFLIYKFDIKLRNLFLRYILLFENEFKTFLSLKLSFKYNSAPYFNDNIYSKNNKKLIEDFKKKISSKMIKPDYDCVEHFLDKGELVPTWALFNFLNFGDIRLFYKILNDSLRFKIAKKYKLKCLQVDSFLWALNTFRNVCAHGNRLLNFKLRDLDKAISNTDIHEKLMIKNDKGDYVCGKRDLFSVVICLKYFLTNSDFDKFKKGLMQLFDDLKTGLNFLKFDCILFEMGFPTIENGLSKKNWFDVL